MVIEKDFILNTFLKLTSNTYPYGYEDELVSKMVECGFFPSLEKDVHGNYFYKIGDSRTVFASHLDTACKDFTPVNHIIEGNIIKTDGKTILGADDKAGVTVMLYMMTHNIPGLYYFFIGEEVGCIGSGLASKYGDFKGKYDRIISFDRRGTNSVITYQSGSRCCSDLFANKLSKELNKSGMSYVKDDTGVYTDSAEFTDIIPECTNISVGYYKEHTYNESQDIEHLIKLANACINVEWEKLPINRDPRKTEYKSYGQVTSYGVGYGYSSYSTNWRSRSYGYHDDWYGDEDKSWKKTRRARKKSKYKPRQYYDNGGDLIEMKNNSYRTHYDNIISKFCGNPLTFQELDIIKDQYLDMNVESDRMFYSYLIDYIGENINEDNQ